MKRKFLAVVFVILAAVLLVGIFAGCGAGTANASVTLNKRYIAEGDLGEPEDEQVYFEFTSGNTGVYHYYYHGDYGTAGVSLISSYSVHFRYKIVSDMVYCFYDSVEYDEADTEKAEVETDWKRYMGADTDFLMSASGSFYFCEDYLAEIPDFGK
ncbi:MAG TPA: hypothetical protein H9726_06605 [Candidatus Borkfalkia avicola]|uniref:Uncharacterized protein n=1 Tax=Candidatus Borkfalkia avicola TaxID=2838503 RepID=A0A9D2D7N4_9FIRM|nr:hypothetical protein [Candidatus Borkfalkia avicola]